MAKVSTRNITRQNVEDILDTAGYGIGYWARTATVHSNLSYTFIEKAEANGEREKAHTITISQIKKAIVHLAENRWTDIQAAFNEWSAEDGIDTGYVDSIAADAIVQQAAFGKVVYG
jgi:hypothetical protein